MVFPMGIVAVAELWMGIRLNAVSVPVCGSVSLAQ